VHHFEKVSAGVGPDPELYEPSVMEASWSEPATDDGTRVHFAAPSARDRVDRHIAAGCEHCVRPEYAFPEAPGRWDSVQAWQRRWESTGLSASEAALWTDAAGCRPDVAMVLRASGLPPQRLQRCICEWIGDPSWDTTALADELLPWVRSGFSWAEIEKTRAWAGLGLELSLARTARPRSCQ